MSIHLRRSALLLLASFALAACSDGGSTNPGGDDDPAGGGGSNNTTIKLTVKIDVPATNTSGDVFLRWGAAAFTRAQMTFQDYTCSSGQGPKTCTFTVPKGNRITVVANDQQAEAQIFTVTPNSQNQDPRGIRSQFDGFGAGCLAGESVGGGLCVLLADVDQTIEVRYKPLHWTRINFVGVALWKLTVSAPPTYGITTGIKTDFQTIITTPGTNQAAGETPQCTQTALVPTHCYSIITADETSILFEPVSPPASTKPADSPGPITLVSLDNGCSASNPICNLPKNVSQTLNVKWEYYQCGGSPITTNPIWKMSASQATLTGCVLRQP